MRLTAGQRHDSTQAQALLEGFTFARVIADRGYAAAAFVAALQEHGSEAVIPPHQRARVKRAYDTWLYHLAVARAPFDRMVYQQAQALPSDFLPLRQAGSLLPGLRPLCLCPHLVTLKCQQNLGKYMPFSVSAKYLLGRRLDSSFDSRTCNRLKTV